MTASSRPWARIPSGTDRLLWTRISSPAIDPQATRELGSSIGDGDAFLSDLVRAGLGRLSASPLHLLDAAQQWQQTGRLPDNEIASLEFETGRLLSEINAYRIASDTS